MKSRQGVEPPTWPPTVKRSIRHDDRLRMTAVSLREAHSPVRPCAVVTIDLPFFLMQKMTPVGLKIGVIADTHGLLRPEAIEILTTCRYIIHAGDVGKPEVLEQLRVIATTFAVRGNVDKGSWAEKLPYREVVEIGNRSFYLVHRLEDLDLDPSAGFDAVVYGHSHIPGSYHRNGVLYFNPGSAGPKRFRLPVSMGQITLTDDGIESHLITLL